MLYSLPKSSNRAAIGDLQSFKAVGKKKKIQKDFCVESCLKVSSISSDPFVYDNFPFSGSNFPSFTYTWR